MLDVDNLVELAEELRRRGIQAFHDIVSGPGCYFEGLDIDEDFYPLWELVLPENQAALERLDFAAIKARRGASWSVAAPGAAS